MLPDEAKAIILQSSMKQPSAPPPRHRINEHDIQNLISSLQETSIDENPTLPTISASLHAQSEGSQDHQMMSHNVTPALEDLDQDQDQDEQLLAHLTKRKAFPPGNVKRLMSPTANATSINNTSTPTKGQHEINFNGST